MGERKTAGVPVTERIWAILRAMVPEVPEPAMKSLPGQSTTRRATSAMALVIWSATEATARASRRTRSRATARTSSSTSMLTVPSLGSADLGGSYEHRIENRGHLSVSYGARTRDYGRLARDHKVVHRLSLIHISEPTRRTPIS